MGEETARVVGRAGRKDKGTESGVSHHRAEERATHATSRPDSLSPGDLHEAGKGGKGSACWPEQERAERSRAERRSKADDSRQGRPTQTPPSSPPPRHDPDVVEGLN